MTTQPSVSSPASFTEFGKLLRYLRRRARLTQLELAAAVGYTNAHLCRLENGQRRPDPAALAALFIPALGLEANPEWAARLLALGHIRLEAAEDQSPAGSLAGALESIPAPPACFVSRPQTMEHLREVMGRERGLVLSGLPGVGKTCLAAALAHEQAAARPVFWLTLTPGITDSMEVLARQLAWFAWQHGQIRVRPLLRAASPVPRDQQLALLGAALTPLPGLICLDNAHHLPPETVAAVQHLLATTSAQFLFTSQMELPLTGVLHLPVLGLTRAEGWQLLKSLAGDKTEWTEAEGEELLHKTGGNPMLLRLALGYVGGGTPAERLRQLSRQPHWATHLLTGLATDLPLHARGLVSLLSVFRRPVNLDEATFEALGPRATPAFELSLALAETHRRYLIDDPRRAALHPLLQEQWQAALAPPARRHLHRLAARWWEGQSEVVEAAHHFVQGGELSQAADILAAHRNLLIERGQSASAVTVLDSILQRTRTTDLRRRALATRAYLHTGTLRAAEAESDYRAALALTATPALRASLMSEAGPLWVQRGKVEEGVALLQAALAALSPSEAVLIAQLSAILSRLLFRSAQLTTAAAAAERALAVCRQLQLLMLPALDEARAYAHLGLGDVFRLRSDYAGALHHRQQARLAAQRARLPRLECASLDNVGGIRLDMGDLAGAERDRLDALTLARAIGSQYHEAYLLIHLAEVDYLRGDYATALKRLNTGCDLLGHIGETQGQTSADTVKVNLLIVLGRLPEARRLMDSLFTDAQQHLADPLLSRYLARRASLLLLQGDPAAAHICLTEAGELPILNESPSMHMEVTNCAALLALAVGDLARARALTTHAPALAVDARVQFEWDLTRTLVARAHNDLIQARALAEDASARARALNFGLFQRRAQRLLDAMAQPPPLAQWPQMYWVEVND